jgi:hypothetical protein
MKSIGGHVITPEDGNMDEEIDPQVRIDTMLNQSGRLEPPATAFNTRGHILGNDTMLNAAFLSRLMLTHSGLHPDEADVGSEIYALKVEYENLKGRWEASKAMVVRLSSWDSWVQVREANNDEALEKIFTEIESVASELAVLREKLKPLQTMASRGQKAWWPLHNRIQQWSWKLFGVKVKQEEEAPSGVDIDLEKNHAPFKLKDKRFEEKYVAFTTLSIERLRDLVNYTAFFDNYKEAEAIKTDAVEEKCKEEKRKMDDGENDLTQEEVQNLRDTTVPVSDDELKSLHEAFEKIYRTHFFDTSRIFKYYAAGGEGGAATDISMSEWWQLANDCQYPGGKDPNKIEKTDIERCFHETETEEEIAEAGKKAESRKAAEEKAEAALGADEADDMESDDEDDKKKENTEEEDYYDNEYEWDLADGEREIGPEAWIEGLLRVAMYKFRKVGDYPKRLEKIIEEFLIPNACKSNTDTFRGELSMDEVQAVFKALKPQIMSIFKYYARVHVPIPGAPPQEPSMDGPAYMKMCKDSKLVTRKGDLRHDFPELECRKVFNDTQMEEEEAGSVDAGGGADEMIYMEYLECIGAIACFKFPNPYIPLQVKLDDMLKLIMFPNQEKFALKQVKAKGKKKK